MDASNTSPTRLPPLWLLTLVTFNGTLALHIFVPALPAAAANLGASSAAMQMTISLYILGLAFGQLIYGPVADAIGRRSPLITGLVLYTVASAVCSLAPSVDVLLVGRLVQAFGGCAGLLLGRAIVSDISDIDVAVKRLSTLALMLMLGPGLAPIIGAAWVTEFGWRSLFGLLCAFGIVNIVLVFWPLPETGRPNGHIRPSSVVADYLQLLSSRSFVGYAIGGACATTTLYAFLALAPFIYVQQLKRPIHEVGLYIGLLMIGMALGNLLAPWLTARMGIERLMVKASAVSLFSVSVLLTWLLSFGPNVAVVTVLMFVYMIGVGACNPTSSMKVMSVDISCVGSAAGLFGCIQMALGALSTTLATFGSDAAVASTLVLFGGSAIGQAAFQYGLRNDRTLLRRIV